MARKGDKNANRESNKEEALQRYVVPESEIHDFVGSLSVVHVSTAAARLQVVADLTSGAFEERIDQLDMSELELIKRIAEEDKAMQYQRLMKAIIAAAGQDRNGINAAHLTARRTVELAFRCTREYFSALEVYRRSLRLRLLGRSVRVAHPGRRSGVTSPQ